MLSSAALRPRDAPRRTTLVRPKLKGRVRLKMPSTAVALSSQDSDPSPAGSDDQKAARAESAVDVVHDYRGPQALKPSAESSAFQPIDLIPLE